MNSIQFSPDLTQSLIDLSEAAGAFSEAFGLHSGAFLDHVYPPGVSRNAILEASVLDPEIGRPDTAIQFNPESMLIAVPYPLLYPEIRQKLLNRIDAALYLSDIPVLDEYLRAIREYFIDPSSENYFEMNAMWMKTVDLPVIMPIVCDETYCDTRCGMKGTIDSGVFKVDIEMSRKLQLPLTSWSTFLQRLPATPSASPIGFMSARVYRTLSLDGALPLMKLRAWNLPNPHEVRHRSGTHQIIIMENSRRAFDEDLKSAIRSLFGSLTQRHTDDMLFDGLLWTLAAHELGHNYACFQNARKLNDLHDTFEEMKANILPLLWVCFCLESGILSIDDCISSIAVYLALDLQDCILAREMLSRRCYCLATALQMNFMLEHGAVRLEDGVIQIDMSEIWNSNFKLLEKCLRIMAEGDRTEAKVFIRNFGNLSPLSRTLDRMCECACPVGT